MKIGFCGAGGTGKTTLAKRIAGTTLLPFIESPSRTVFAKHNVRREDDQNAMTPDQRYALQKDIFIAIDHSCRVNMSGVFDRTHLDNLAYACLRCNDVMPNDQFDQFSSVTVMGLRSFDHIFFAPIYDWRTINDNMRTQSLAARNLISAFTYNFLLGTRLKFHVLPDISLEARTDLILKAVS